MRARTLELWLFVCAMALVAPSAALAAGLGKLVVLSTLGQPLNAEIELLSVQKGETITARLASQEVYQQAGVQFNNALTGTRVSVEKRANGQLYLKATTPRPVNEPFIEILIEMNSENGRVVRQYTALLDPPGYGRAAGEIPPPAKSAEAKPPVSAPPPPSAATAPAPAGSVAEAPLAPPTQPPARPRQKSTPAAGDQQYGPVKRGETLGSIARSVRPEGVTLEQALVSLYQRNPDAFINRNMNLIKSGKILRVPDAREMATVGQGEAAQEVRVQVADFNAYRNRVADRAVSASEAGSVRSGRIEPRAAEAPGGAAPRDRVRVSRGEPAEKGAGVSMNVAERVRALEEEVIAREKALAEANERITQLERIIKDTQRAIELKSSTMAAAQSAAEKPAPAAASPAEPAAKGSQEPARAEAPAAPPSEPAKGPDATQATAPPKEAPQPPQAKAAPAPQPPPAQPDFLDTVMEEPLYLAAAGAAIVLGGVGFLLVRRRRAAERTWREADDDDRVAPTLGGSTEDEPTASTLLSPERPREVPTARGERPQPAPPAATAAIVAALAGVRKEAGAEDNDLDFHGKRDARVRHPVGTIERAARPAQAGEPAVAPGAKDQAKTPSPPPPGAGREPPNLQPLPQSGATREPSKPPPVPDFALDEPPTTRTGGESRAKSPHEIDFDLDPLPAIDTGKVAPAGRPNVDFKLDLDDLDLNAPGQRSGDAGRDAHWHDVQQKFELAKAYEDMGDKQGARDILQEVIREGDTAQQVQARRRLELLS